jgi:hypothetical protein
MRTTTNDAGNTAVDKCSTVPVNVAESFTLVGSAVDKGYTVPDQKGETPSCRDRIAVT